MGTIQVNPCIKAEKCGNNAVPLKNGEWLSTIHEKVGEVTNWESSEEIRGAKARAECTSNWKKREGVITEEM
ncbi:hypothetical protein CHS0354_004084, partial [Potamilus streckersoni]